jgi:hypothetical protein
MLAEQATKEIRINLSDQAIKDLRVALRVSYGNDFDCNFSDEEISEIGEVLLAILAGSLKIKMRSKERCLKVGPSEINRMDKKNYPTLGHDKN